MDILHHDFAAQHSLVLLHLLEDILQLVLPGLLVLFEDLVDAVFEEDALQAGVVPVVFELGKAYAELLFQQVAGVEGIVLEDVVDRKELRLVLHDHAGIRGNVGLAVGESVEGIDGLVGGDIVGKMDDDVHLVGGHIFDLLDLYLPLILGLEYGIYEDMGGFPVGNLGNGYGVLVELVDAGAHLDGAAALALVVFAAVGGASGREVRINLVGLALENLYRRIQQLVEVVGENLGCHTYGDALGPLREQQRETHREFGRLLVAPVVGVHPVGNLRVEDYFLREL